MSSKNISDYVYLAEASYADFTGISDFSDIISKREQTIERIKNTDPEKPTAKEFAELVTNNYEVKAHWTDRTNESSFSGTLFKSTSTDGSNSTPTL